MTTSNPTERVPSLPRLVGRFSAALFALAACCVAPSAAQETHASAAASLAAQQAQVSLTNHAPASYSPGVSELLKMADAGVSGQVIKTYVECSTTAYHLTDVDVIALKKHNVSDEVVTLLLQRGAQARAAAAQARTEALARALSAKRTVSGGLDPESYEYFRYYYLQPRALAGSSQNFYTPYPASFGYPYGYPLAVPPGSLLGR